MSSTGASDLVNMSISDTNLDVDRAVEEHSLRQTNDSEAVAALAQALIADFPDQVAEYKDGNENILKFLMGQGMKRSGGQINPQMLTKVIQDEIN